MNLKLGGQRVVFKPRPIMLNFLPIMLLSSTQKVAYYAQYYAMTTALSYSLYIILLF